VNGTKKAETTCTDPTPVSTAAESLVVIPKGTSVLRPLSYPPISSLSEDFQEAFFYGVYCSSTSTLLSGHFTADLWGQLIPKACADNTSIRHVVIAIAALSVASKGHPEAQMHHQFGYGNIAKVCSKCA
jgi:hypothetical protein